MLFPYTTHPQNIFGESVLLFVTGVILLVRDRGSAVASTTYDTLLGLILLIFSIIRLVEFLGGSRDGHVMARSIVWMMWLLPVAILSWLTYMYRRLDLGVVLTVSILAQIGVTIYLMNGSGGFNVIAPDERVGASDGVYLWVRTDGALLFMPFAYYLLLAVTLIYLTAFSIRDRTYWLFAGLTTLAFVISAIFIPQITKNPIATLGSLSSMVMLGLGVFAILLVPG